MSVCQACGGVIGRDCFNPQECMEITQQQAAAYRHMSEQQIVPPSHEMREPSPPASNYIETLRYNWGHANDGTTWESFLEKKVAELRDGVSFWSYCTDSGMRRECPERVDELCDFLMSLGIAPYSMRR